jgi:alpha-1,3-rhamnosyl/mannosyltransferase
LGIRGPFILAVGTLFPHKNYPRLLEAYSLLPGAVQFPLVCAGLKGNQFNRLQDLRRELRIPEEKVTFLGFVNDSVLRTLYRHARLFVMPSFFEGFGLPVLEAMSSGCPVCCSRAASLPEVAGDAAAYFDPFDVKGIATAVIRVLTEEQLRLSLISKGFEQACRFSWLRAARETLAVYQKVAG